MGRHGIYFFFDCKKMTFNVSFHMLFKNIRLIGTLGSMNEIGALEGCVNDRKILQLRFEKIVSNFNLKNEAASTFSIIINCINPNFIRLHNLTIIFYCDRKKKVKKLISAVDYISCVLTEQEIPSTNLIALHRFVQSFCYIPKNFNRTLF